VRELKFIPLAQANSFVIANHRHHGAAQGHKFSIGLFEDGGLVGVAIVGRPTGRYLDDGETLEVTRNCTNGIRNGCSQLYGACAREAKRRGYAKVITFILESELGTSLRASGWECVAHHCGKPKWNAQRYAKKPKQLTIFADKTPPAEYKQRWEKQIKLKGAKT
jgi:hypothetical protein